MATSNERPDRAAVDAPNAVEEREVHLFAQGVPGGSRHVRRVTIYRDDSTVQVVYDRVKSVFWTAGNSVLVVARYDGPDTEAHHYIHWPRERFAWFKDEPREVAPSLAIGASLDSRAINTRNTMPTRCPVPTDPPEAVDRFDWDKVRCNYAHDIPWVWGVLKMLQELERQRPTPPGTPAAEDETKQWRASPSPPEAVDWDKVWDAIRNGGTLAGFKEYDRQLRRPTPPGTPTTSFRKATAAIADSLPSGKQYPDPDVGPVRRMRAEPAQAVGDDDLCARCEWPLKWHGGLPKHLPHMRACKRALDFKPDPAPALRARVAELSDRLDHSLCEADRLQERAEKAEQQLAAAQTLLTREQRDRIAAEQHADELETALIATRAELSEARAEVTRMRPVFDAADAWQTTPPQQLGAATGRLAIAICKATGRDNPVSCRAAEKGKSE